MQLPAGETTEEEIGYSLWELQLYGMKGIGALGLGVRAVTGMNSKRFSRVLLKWRHPFTERTRLIQALSLASSIVLLLLKDLDTMSKRLRRSTIASAPPGLDALSAFLLTNQEGEKAVMVELTNNTDDALIVHVSDVSIDGALAYEGPWTVDTVAPGKRFVIDDLLLSSMVEDKADRFDLSKVGNVSMTISITDANRNTILDSAELTVSF